MTWKPAFGKCFTASSFSFALLVKSLWRKHILRHGPQCKSGSMSIQGHMGVLRFLLSLGSQYLPSPLIDLNKNMSYHTAVLTWKKALRHKYLFRKLFHWVDNHLPIPCPAYMHLARPPGTLQVRQNCIRLAKET